MSKYTQILISTASWLSQLAQKHIAAEQAKLESKQGNSPVTVAQINSMKDMMSEVMVENFTRLDDQGKLRAEWLRDTIVRSAADVAADIRRETEENFDILFRKGDKLQTEIEGVSDYQQSIFRTLEDISSKLTPKIETIHVDYPSHTWVINNLETILRLALEIQNGRKIESIRALRLLTKCGLSEGKHAVEAAMENHFKFFVVAK